MATLRNNARSENNEGPIRFPFASSSTYVCTLRRILRRKKPDIIQRRNYSISGDDAGSISPQLAANTRRTRPNNVRNPSYRSPFSRRGGVVFVLREHRMQETFAPCTYVFAGIPRLKLSSPALSLPPPLLLLLHPRATLAVSALPESACVSSSRPREKLLIYLSYGPRRGLSMERNETKRNERSESRGGMKRERAR